MLQALRGGRHEVSGRDHERIDQLRIDVTGAPEAVAAAAVCATARELLRADGATLHLEEFGHQRLAGSAGAVCARAGRVIAPVHRGPDPIGTLIVHGPARRRDATGDVARHIADAFGEVVQLAEPALRPLSLPSLLAGLRIGDLLVLLGAAGADERPTVPGVFGALRRTDAVAVTGDELVVRVRGLRGATSDEAGRFLRHLPGAAAGASLHLPMTAPVDTFDGVRLLLGLAVERGPGVLFVAPTRRSPIDLIAAERATTLAS